MTFHLPGRVMHTVDVHRVDRPSTLCKVVDVVVTKLSSTERAVLAELMSCLDSKEKNKEPGGY